MNGRSEIPRAARGMLPDDDDMMIVMVLMTMMNDNSKDDCDGTNVCGDE